MYKFIAILRIIEVYGYIFVLSKGTLNYSNTLFSFYCLLFLTFSKPNFKICNLQCH